MGRKVRRVSRGDVDRRVIVCFVIGVRAKGVSKW